MKRCPTCGAHKSREEFPRNRRSKDGRGSYCKPCHNRRTRENIKRLHGDTRHYHYRQKYGLSRAEVEQMIADQGGLCPICNKRPATQVDHDHRTGKVRAILCLKCNAGLGALKDDLRLVWSAVDYLHPIPLEELVR